MPAWLPPDERYRHVMHCLIACEDQRYEFVGLVVGDADAVARLMADGQVQVALVARADHLPDRVPRWELAGEPRPAACQPHPGRRRRTQINRGPAAT